MIVVISLGGSVLEKIEEIAEVIRKISSRHKVYIVVGGGPLSRRYIERARKLSASEAKCDVIGIDATRLNARLLLSAFKDLSFDVPRTYEEAASLNQRIVIMGGVSPGHTTDAVAAILAEYVGADLFINATSIDGVYTSDPRKDKKARKLRKLTPSRLVEIVSRQKMVAGPSTVMDLLAAKVIQRSGIRTIVIDGRDPGNILKAVSGKHSGTEIGNGKISGS